MEKLTDQLKSQIDKQNIPGIDGLKSDLQISKPEIIVDIDKEKIMTSMLIC